MSKKDITSCIERLQGFEARAGVEFHGLSAFIDESLSEDIYVEIRGEMHPVDGSKLPHDVTVVFAAYDGDNRVVGTAEEFFNSESFFGFDVFNVMIELPNPQVSKIGVHPKVG